MTPLWTTATRPSPPRCGMGVAVVGRAMRGPAGVADAGAAGSRLIAQTAGPGRAMRPARLRRWRRLPVKRGQAGSCRSRDTPADAALHQDRLRFPGTDIADNSAHARFLRELQPPILGQWCDPMIQGSLPQEPFRQQDRFQCSHHAPRDENHHAERDDYTKCFPYPVRNPPASSL